MHTCLDTCTHCHSGHAGHTQRNITHLSELAARALCAHRDESRESRDSSLASRLMTLVRVSRHEGSVHSALSARNRRYHAMLQLSVRDRTVRVESLLVAPRQTEACGGDEVRSQCIRSRGLRLAQSNQKGIPLLRQDSRGKREAKRRQQLGKQQKRELSCETKAQHRAFPRGPPPQYYPGSTLLNFAVRMGSGEPG